MSSKRNHHSKQFKLDAINYRNEHPDLTQVECAKNLGIGVSTLAKWESQFYSHAYRLVFEYIEAFCNTVRIHSHCGYMSPYEFEALYNKTNVLPAS